MDWNKWITELSFLPFITISCIHQFSIPSILPIALVQNNALHKSNKSVKTNCWSQRLTATAAETNAVTITYENNNRSTVIVVTDRRDITSDGEMKRNRLSASFDPDLLALWSAAAVSALLAIAGIGAVVRATLLSGSGSGMNLGTGNLGKGGVNFWLNCVILPLVISCLLKNLRKSGDNYFHIQKETARKIEVCSNKSSSSDAIQIIVLLNDLDSKVIQGQPPPTPWL